MLQQLSNVNFVADRHKKNAGRKERHGYKCTCCGKVNHKPFDWKFENYTCNYCSEVGHLLYVCPERNKNKNKQFQNKSKRYMGNRQDFVEEVEMNNGFKDDFED